MIKDLVPFLNPISEDDASGPYIRYSETYRIIQSIKSSATSSKEVDYKQLEKLCEDVLVYQSKDLHVAALLAEAWVALYELKGLADGLNLILRLCERFWLVLHPQIQEDLDARISIFEWINDKLSDAMLGVRITQPSIAGGVAYTLADLIDARQLDLTLQRAGLRKSSILEAAQNEGRPTLSDIMKATLISPAVFYEELLEDSQASTISAKQLEEFMEQHLKDDMVALRGFDGYLAQIETFSQSILEQKRTLPVTREPVQVAENYCEPEVNPLNVDEMELEDLYDILEKIAQRVEVLEPKSPTPKLIRKAVRWGSMSAIELLTELGEQNLSISEVNKILS